MQFDSSFSERKNIGKTHFYSVIPLEIDLTTEGG